MPAAGEAPEAGPVSQNIEESGQSAPEDQHFPVVAVGASAGGLEAFTELLHGLRADTGMAFIFIQHLAPSHESMLAHLLARQTGMPVEEAQDGTVLAPDHVYVIPANAVMTISGLRLVLRPRETAGTAVDAFFRSLAASQKHKAVAVILSGTGSDGALGVQAIAEEGGVVFAEDPVSARFDGMPRSAMATGCVDFVLPPQMIAAELARIAREPGLIRGLPELTRESPDSEKDFQAMLDLLRARTGIDFGIYRQTTVRRRALRRMALLKQAGFGAYSQYLQQNPDEAHSLAQDILIRVTRFFRDPEAFEALRQRVFPALIRRAHQNSLVRIWVPGCSTGEEAYSVAICFLETAAQMQSRIPAQIFATDINEAAIEKARRGIYIENIAADVSPERMARFFVRVGREFQVNRRLRDLCVFSPHDVLKDPPFSRMDLVTCRNVLIYLDSMQANALYRFHFALNPGGFLLLGKSESASACPELFAPFDKEAKLYVRQESVRHSAPAHRTRKKPEISPPQRETRSADARPPHRIDLRRQADRIVLNRYGPPRVIVNASLEPIEQAGENSSGPEVQDYRFLEEIRKHDRDAAARAIQEAGGTGRSVRVEGMKTGEGASPRDIEVTPLGPDRRHYLMTFEQRTEPEPQAGEPLARAERRKLRERIGRLEKELASNQAHLESVIVEQEAANEEIVASNEELQSLNEELESSKEELEAANEELTTVNQELQVRNTELDSAREFAQATIDTVRGSLIVLGPDLRVLKANQSFYRTFQLAPAEVEQRYIYELGKGRWSNPKLRMLLEETLPESHSMEDFELEQELPSTGRRVLLLNARRFEREERILLSIEDVTESRHREQQLRESQKMEAIGYLAAGVAHDFNNLLTGIMGYASLVSDTLRKDDPNRPAVENIIGGSRRAADLTRQLLAYAGKGRYYLERVDLSEVALETSRLVHPSIAQNVQLRLDLDRNVPLFLADVGQMQQVVMNLVINAVEAIGDARGTVLVRTGRQTVTGEGLPDLYFKDRVAPGEYAFVEVRDDGSGIDEQTMRRIFDPFFTTKFTGRGLGLSAVLGIVRQQKGTIQVHSVRGRGSSFRTLFPTGESAASEIAGSATIDDLRGSGTVLVIDDEEVIRTYTKAALDPYGYTVLLAADGQEGVRLMEEKPGDIGLVLLDMAMPGLDGPATLEQIRAIRPDVPVIVSSGFGDTDAEKRFAGKDVSAFFQKPYTVRQLASKIKEYMPPHAGGEPRK